MTIDGNYTQGADGTLQIIIEGPDPGWGGYGLLEIHGNAQLDGTLDITNLASFDLLDGTLDITKLASFDLLEGMEFTILDLTDPSAILSGFFAGLPEGAVAWNGVDYSLFVTYLGGDGNDVVLFAAVPEPGSLALLASGGLCLVLLFRRKRFGVKGERRQL